MDILKEFRVETEWAMMKTTNDMFAKHTDGTWKKFFGGAYKYTDWEYGYQDMSITYDFDYKTAEKVRNFDGKIRVKKFDIDDIRDVVGGLCEINPNFNRVEFEEKIVDRICDKFDYIRKDDILSEDDEIKLLENGTKRNTEKDWLYYGRNKGFAKWSKY
jgi:lipoate-protein ligase A